jgi:catechol 2,3-dioxygenase
MPTEDPLADAKVDALALRVEDLEEAATFYSSVVGLQPMERHDEGAVLGAGDDELLHLLEAPDAAPRRMTQAGLFHAAFRVPTRADLAAALARVRGEWRLAGASDHQVSEALYLTDPEGNGVEIYRDRPRESWPAPDDGSVGMTTDPLDLAELAADGPPKPEERVPDGADLGHVHLEATERRASERFHVEGLGMRVRDRYGDDAVFLAYGDYHHHVGVNTWNRRTEPAGGRGLAWFQMQVPDEDAVAAVAADLEELGVAVEGGASGVAVRDPDGIRVRVVAD